MQCEGLKAPAVMVGTGSDRIGTPGGQSIYATASNDLRRETKPPIAPYFGLSYGTCRDSLRMIGGINLGCTESLNSMVIFDEVHVRTLVSFSHGRHVFAFRVVRSRQQGLSHSTSFQRFMQRRPLPFNQDFTGS